LKERRIGKQWLEDADDALPRTFLPSKSVNQSVSMHFSIDSGSISAKVLLKSNLIKLDIDIDVLGLDRFGRVKDGRERKSRTCFSIEYIKNGFVGFIWVKERERERESERERERREEDSVQKQKKRVERRRIRYSFFSLGRMKKMRKRV
jgi:hypothetical protein